MGNYNPFKNNVIIWTDVETAGLDPSLPLLQIAAIATDVQGNELLKPFERIFGYTVEEVIKMMDTVDPVVRKMHERTDLWERLTWGSSAKTIDTDFADYIQQAKVTAGTTARPRVGGSSIRLDLNFLDHHLPIASKLLHYRSVDTTAINFMMTANSLMTDAPAKPEKARTHDALDDIRESLEEYRWILAHLKGESVAHL